MKVAYLASRYPDISHTFIRREVDALRNEGVDVTTFTVRRSERSAHFGPADHAADSTTTAILPISPLAFAGVQMAALLRSPRGYLGTMMATLRSAPVGVRAWIWAIFYFFEGVVLWSHCESVGIRHIHAHFANVGADVARAAVRFGRSCDGPDRWSWSFTMHGSTEFYNVRAFDLGGKADDADAVVCISDFARSQIMMHAAPGIDERVSVVHCGIDVEEYSPAPTSEEHGPLQVLFLGRLVVEKGPVVLVEALGLLVASGVDARLTIAGDGPARAEVERMIYELGLVDRVDMQGTVPPNETRDLYRRADVFCLPSFAEGVPVVLMEAMSCAVPVVTTYITGIPELVTDGVEGYTVTPGRADQVANAIRELSVPARRVSMGAEGRQKVAREFDIRSVGPQLKAVFEKLPGAQDRTSGS